jgi:hypothetical protein
MEIAAQDMPSDQIENFMQRVELTFTKMQEKSKENAAAQIQDQVDITDETIEQMNKRIEGQIQSNDMQLEMLTSYSSSFEEIFTASMGRIFENAQTLGESVSKIIGSTYDNMTKAIGKGVADAIIDGKKISEVMKDILKNVAKQVISMFVTMGIQRAIMSAIYGTASSKEAMAALSSGFAQTYTNAFAATAAIPIVGPALAPGVATASLLAVQAGAITAGGTGAATGAAITGAPHGGLDYVPAESTYLLAQGERVISPKQNEDLTSFLSDEGTSGNSQTKTVIENLNVDFTVGSLDGLTEDDLLEFTAGVLIPALNRLDEEGVRQTALERSSL